LGAEAAVAAMGRPSLSGTGMLMSLMEDEMAAQRAQGEVRAGAE
jgi:hypothetical protein